MPKKPVISLNPKNGVSYDFCNEVVPLHDWATNNLKGDNHNTYNDFVELVNGGLPRLYEERFPSSQYEDVVNKKNETTVSKLNGKIIEIRELKDPSKFSWKKLLKLCNDVINLTREK